MTNYNRLFFNKASGGNIETLLYIGNNLADDIFLITKKLIQKSISRDCIAKMRLEK